MMIVKERKILSHTRIDFIVTDNARLFKVQLHCSDTIFTHIVLEYFFIESI